MKEIIYDGIDQIYEEKSSEVSINNYFKEFDFKDNIVIISSLDDASKNWSLFEGKSILGLTQNVGWRCSYIAIVDKSTSFLYEDQSSSAISYIYQALDGVTITIYSSGYNCRPLVSKILINDKEYSQNKRGLNIVIFNKKLSKVIDSFNCDFFGDPKLLTIRYSVDSIFADRLKMLEHGMQLARQYCSLDNTTLYFVLNSHLGDAARDLKILRPIRLYYGKETSKYHFDDTQTYGINSKKFVKIKQIYKICIITTKSISGVVRLYEKYVDEVIIFPKKELDAIELYAYSQCGVHENIVADENAAGLLKRWNFDETDWTRWLMFHVSYLMWKFCLPRSVMKHEASMSISDSTLALTDEVISTYGINTKRSVIICPVSRSSSKLSDLIWEKYSKYLVSIGYDVFTNVGINEQAINGTKPLSVDVDVIVGLSCKGVKIVGVQCGLMDILVWSRSSNLLILNVIKTTQDKAYAHVAGAINEVNIKPKNVTYLRIEHFEEDYVLKLLMDNFH